MNYIELSQGKRAIVDKDDYEYLNQFNWHYHKKPKDKYGYAVSSTHPLRSKKMHRVVMGAEKGQIIDHINHNGLDNRKENLRFVNSSESASNRRMKNKYKYRGISKIKDRNGNPKYWIARITIQGERIYLGSFSTDIEAARAYDKAIDKHHNGIGPKNNV